jgi:quinohemoprotein amine dehydrogenase
MIHTGRIAFALAMLVAAQAAAAQGRGGRGAGGGGGGAPPADTATGFAVNDTRVIQQCARCHRRDSTTGIMQRVSFERKTPEGWEMSVRRMAQLNKVELAPADARAIVRYLSNSQGLAPAEVKPGRFEAERRVIEYRYTADPATENVCRACHSMGRVITQRRTREEWSLLVATHRGLYPNVDFQRFRRGGPPAPGDTSNPQHPMETAINHLARAFPLRTPEWTAWSASMRNPPIDGTWLISGSELGKGTFFGKVTIAKSATAADEFTTKATYRYTRDGKVVTRTGTSIVYTGFQWRGRSKETPADSGLREVMFVEPGWQEMSGRWFRGSYDEFGLDVTLTRATAAPAIAGVSRRTVQTNVKDQDLMVFGANFPRVVTADLVDLGPGIKVTRVVRATPDSIAVRIDVDSGATLGTRDLFVAGAAMRDGLRVYDKIDRIKVTPEAGMARTGGANFPKQYQQFDVVAVNNGPDGRANTADDIELGPVPVTWSLEEYGVTYRDDDVQFVGAIDRNGLFTPNVDGPNPQRSANRNNIGDVWVVATWQPPGAGARPVKARGHLVVTVPLYAMWTSGTVTTPAKGPIP